LVTGLEPGVLLVGVALGAAEVDGGLLLTGAVGLAPAELDGAELDGAGLLLVPAYCSTSCGGLLPSRLSKDRVAVAVVVTPKDVLPCCTAAVTSASVHWPEVSVAVLPAWAPSAGRLAQFTVASAQLAEVLNTFERVTPLERANNRRVALVTVAVGAAKRR
jgi:hypothetical protein